MELNWSTFALEILNFLVLVWILKRFLYRPVLAVIARRREAVERQLAEAAAQREQAEALQANYQARLQAWEQERRGAREQLAADIDAERSRRLAALQAELEQQQQKAAAAEAHRLADLQHQAELTALQQAARFAARLLEQVASPELEQRLVERVLQDLSQLPAQRLAAMRDTWGGSPQDVVVSSAFPLDEAARRRLQAAVSTLTGADAPVRFEQQPELLAGVRLSVGAWVLGGNLRDELAGLAAFAHDVRAD